MKVIEHRSIDGVPVARGVCLCGAEFYATAADARSKAVATCKNRRARKTARGAAALGAKG